MDISFCFLLILFPGLTFLLLVLPPASRFPPQCAALPLIFLVCSLLGQIFGTGLPYVGLHARPSNARRFERRVSLSSSTPLAPPTLKKCLSLFFSCTWFTFPLSQRTVLKGPFYFRTLRHFFLPLSGCTMQGRGMFF